MFRSFCMLLLCAVLTSCATSPSAAPQDAESEVRQASDRFWATRERADAAALADLFTEEGILMVPGLPDAVGRNEVRDLLQQRFARARTTEFKVHRREIEVLGDSAYELAWFSEVSRVQEPTRMEGHYVLVWSRGRDDVWRVHRYVYNFSDMTPL